MDIAPSNLDRSSCAVVAWRNSSVDPAQAAHPSGRDAPKGTDLRLGLSMQTHTYLNERSHNRASAYFKSTSALAHQLLSM